MYFIFSEITESAIESTNSTYQIIERRIYWLAAQAHCRAIDGHLLALETKEEYDSISAIISNGAYSFGLNDIKVERKYVWEHSGQELGTYQPWSTNEPTNTGYEDCGLFYYGRWVDVRCSYSVYFICEFPKE